MLARPLAARLLSTLLFKEAPCLALVCAHQDMHDHNLTTSITQSLANVINQQGATRPSDI